MVMDVDVAMGMGKEMDMGMGMGKERDMGMGMGKEMGMGMGIEIPTVGIECQLVRCKVGR